MNLIASIVRRPYMVAVAVLLVSLFSWLALQKIPVQLKPTVDKPIITITTSYRGASAGEVEEAVTRELEEVLQRVQGVIEMASESTEGLSTITLEFAYGTDTKLSAIDVVNQLSRVPALPLEADEPAIQIGGREEENAVMWLAVRTHYDANKARRIVEESVRSRLERVDGVSGLFLVGYGLLRFVAEYFREPDAFLGLLALGMSMGQWLCVPMVLAGAGLWLRSRRVS